MTNAEQVLREIKRGTMASIPQARSLDSKYRHNIIRFITLECTREPGLHYIRPKIAAHPSFVYRLVGCWMGWLNIDDVG